MPLVDLSYIERRPTWVGAASPLRPCLGEPVLTHIAACRHGLFLDFSLIGCPATLALFWVQEML